jgi:hypothetical protein
MSQFPNPYFLFRILAAKKPSSPDSDGVGKIMSAGVVRRHPRYPQTGQAR